MPTLSSLSLPPPRNWQDFEDLCCDLWRRLWKDPDAQKNGRSGQPQAGVDVFGRPGRGSDYAGVQCKLRETASGLSRMEIEQEVERARSFTPALGRFLIATTAPRDVGVQQAAREITAAQLERQSFPVTVVSWEDILLELAAFPDLVAKHYPDFALRLSKGSVQAPSGVTAVPSFPPHYLPRPEALAVLKSKLLAGDGAPLGITSARQAVGVQGMGGIGKSVLASALAWDPEVRAAFPDGIFWVAVGQQPDLVRSQIELAVAAGEPRPVLDYAHEGTLLLSRLFADRAVLLVLDDVWDLDHATVFGIPGLRGRLLLTTRNSEILIGLGAEEYRVDVLDPDAALHLLSDWAGQRREDLPPEAIRVAQECGYLPLALAMIGAMVRLRPTAWNDALERLTRADLGKIRRNFPNYPYPDLLRAIEVSVEALEPWERERYLELAVFPEEADIPETALETLWTSSGLVPMDARDLASRLVARSLAQRDAKGRLRLHDLQADYLRYEAGDLLPLHNRLVNAYAVRCTQGFASGPDDGYFFQNFTAHLREAGRKAELRELLLDYSWLEAKLNATDVNALLSDYDALPTEPEIRLVQRALRLSAHALLEAREELPGQLHGRLLTRADPGIVNLLKKAQRSQKRPWLCPIGPGLTPAGGALVQILTGHSEGINAVAVLPDSRVVSASGDHTLRVWDLVSGEAIQSFRGHEAEVTSVAVTPLGRILSASTDGSLRIWDIETGNSILTLHEEKIRAKIVIALPDGCIASASNNNVLIWDVSSGKIIQALTLHQARINALAVLHDGRIVSASSDCTLRIWDPARGRIQVLEGHTDWVKTVAVLPGERLISGSSDCTLRVWDITSGRTLLRLEGHSTEVNSVVALPDGRIASASERSLRIWDLTAGRPIQMLEGHSAKVRAVAALPDGRLISGSQDRTLRVWDIASTATFQRMERHPDEVTAIGVLSDERLVSTSADGSVRVWTVPSGKTVRSFEGIANQGRALAVLSTGHVVFATDCSLRIIDVDSGKTLLVFKGPADRVNAVAVLPNGHLLSASAEGNLTVWSVNCETGTLRNSGRMILTLKTHPGIRTLAVLPDGKVVFGSHDRTLRIWDPETGYYSPVIREHGSGVRALAILPEGKVVSASYDRTLRMLDPSSGKTLQVFEGHSEGVYGVTVLTGGYLVSASNDRTVRVWDITTGRSFARLTLDDPPAALAALDEGEQFAVGDRGGHVFLLRLEKPS